MTPELSPHQTAVMLRQIATLLPRSPGFRQLSNGQQREVSAHTERLATILETAPQRPRRDPFAVPLAAPLAYGAPEQQPGPPGPPAILPQRDRRGPQRIAQRPIQPVAPAGPPAHNQNRRSFQAAGAMAGAAAAGALMREVDFPAFVAELVQGTFNAIVQATIEQMRAYGELVQSVVMSTNDFRDQNVTDNEARDHLVSKYPNLMQISVGDSGPTVSPKGGGFFDDLPDLAGEFGLSEPISDLDEETIEEKLVPAARNELALSRQRLLATMVLMGINRIIITDGRINAKVRFTFKASDRMNRQAMAIDYDNLGTTVVEYEDTQWSDGVSQAQSTEGAETTPADGTADGGAGNQGAQAWLRNTYNYVEKPEIKVASLSKTTSDAAISTEGAIMGEVALNFRSETFPLEQLVQSDQLFRLEQLQTGAGRGAPPAGTGSPAADTPPQSSTTTSPPS